MKMSPAKVIEVENEGLISLIDQYVLIFCFNYFYYGKLIGVNTDCIKLEKVYIVYETGSFTDPSFKDAQKISEEWYVQLSAIESFGKSLKTVL
jgi:hypothetical protein